MLAANKFRRGDGLPSRVTFEGVDTNSLYKILSQEHILEIKKIFERSDDGQLYKSVLQEALRKIGNVDYSNAEMESMFLKMQADRYNDKLCWTSFLSYLMYEFQQDHSLVTNRLELPITGISKILKTHHRHPVSRIAFIPEINKCRTVNHLYGCYVTLSKDGIINYWSLDMEFERSVQSTCPQLKVQPTWVTDLVPLPDVNVICTSSTERDIRFYDTSAKKFALRIMISSFENAVVTMFYKFYEDPNKSCKLLLGDAGGKVKLITFIPKDRGPFKSKPGNPLTAVRYEQFSKGAISTMTVKELDLRHSDWVRQLSYFSCMHCIISVATCSNVSMYLQSSRDYGTAYVFNVPKGFTCFALDDAGAMIATGGPDCYVRLWNPVVPKRALSLLRGHHAEIISLIFQDNGKTLCSISQDKCVKVWSIADNTCIHTFFNMPANLGERTHFCTFYNPSSREVFVCSMKIVVFHLNALLNGEYTDGISHSKEVSVILYNKLFKYIVSCGYDSFIIIWDPWNGRRLRLIKEAHTTVLHGEIVPLQITAATFDPTNHLLITGATNGTLKVWTISTGHCIRNMSIAEGKEISSIIWLPFRILVMGENQGVTEFADGDDIGESAFKCWNNRHTDDIICAAARLPQALTTASDNGELIFWRLETGQAYGMYNVVLPTERIKLTFKTVKRESVRFTQSITALAFQRKETETKRFLGIKTKLAGPDRKRLQHQHQPAKNRTKSAIHSIVFLNSRPMKPDVGSLLISNEIGNIQMWSHHTTGGYISNFKAIHSVDDYVICMATDEKNDYLFTGHIAGYIKVWHLVNYGIPENEHVHVCMPKLRLIFPFMWKELIIGRAKRAHRNNIPILLSSYKAHMQAVTGLLYIDENKILVSCSSDCSVRLWTLGSRYLGTLGSFKSWNVLTPSVPPDENKEYELPADIKRSLSFTTYKVLHGGKYQRRLTKKQQAAQLETIQTEIKGVYGERVDFNFILGHHFKLPARSDKYPDVKLDTTVHHVPVYNQMCLPEPIEHRSAENSKYIKKICAQKKK